jgi:MSHA biogenesis protein MshG
MPVYRYRARNRRGEAIQGQLEAATADAVAMQLMNSGVTPVEIAPASAGSTNISLRGLLWRRGKVSLVDLIFFSRQMYTLLNAGVPIMQALRGLRDTTKNPALAEVIDSIYEGLDSGLDLTSALRRHPQVFSPLFINLIQVGEASGALAEAFERMAVYLERDKDTRERVKMAMRYPLFVVSAIAVGMVVLNIFVIPAFANLYQKFHATLPWATRLLISISNFVVAYWPHLLVLGTVGVLLTVQYLRTAGGRYRWHRFQLRLPVMGEIFYMSALARFARALELTIRTGVPLVHGMTIVSRAVSNDFLAERALQMRDGIERGESITRTATATGLFPPLVLQMFAVGEETGALDTLMRDVGEYYDREVDYSIKNLSASIEPILIGFVAVMVFIMALGVFLPMWDLAQAVSHSHGM